MTTPPLSKGSRKVTCPRSRTSPPSPIQWAKLTMGFIKIFYTMLRTSTLLPKVVLILWFALSGIPACESLTVFDCANRNTTFLPVDLLEPMRCPDPVADFEDPIHVRAQILQTDTAFVVHAHQCMVTVTKVVNRCGFNSLSYSRHTPVWGQQVEFTPQDCRDAIKSGYFHIMGKTFPAKMGQITKEKYFSHGFLDLAGNCRKASFVTAGLTFHKSYERTSVEIKMWRIRGTADLSTGLVVFPNGI